MIILVVGATGMTGRSLVEQLLDNGHEVRAIVRSPNKFSDRILNDPEITIIESAILDLSDEAMAGYVDNCDAVVSCLGHVMNFKGLFGQPRKLCTDTTRRLCEAIEKNKSNTQTKFILMNSVGVKNPACIENRTWMDKIVLTLLRYIVPPHHDNETAADHLYRNVGKSNKYVEWCSVRPDSLINTPVSNYEIFTSPVTGIFSGSPTSRANVAHFMVSLIENSDIWSTWKFEMPVITDSVK